ncbi:hypothetical protein HN747_01775 [archaeon]|jgi:hypothetical protein|nr:hypothetical protein [archaeon]
MKDEYLKQPGESLDDFNHRTAFLNAAEEGAASVYFNGLKQVEMGLPDSAREYHTQLERMEEGNRAIYGIDSRLVNGISDRRIDLRNRIDRAFGVTDAVDLGSFVKDSR